MSFLILLQRYIIILLIPNITAIIFNKKITLKYNLFYFS